MSGSSISPFRSKRARRPSRRLDLTELREALKDGRIWTGLGLVTQIDAEPYFEIGDGDVLVQIELMPNREPLLCRLGAAPGGCWRIPPVGSEVVVCIPTGELEADPMIAAVLTGGTVPAGLTETTTVIVAPPGGKVLIHDGTTGTEKVIATKDDIDALQGWINGHKHTCAGGTLGLTGSPDSVASGGPSPNADGTAVLKAK